MCDLADPKVQVGNLACELVHVLRGEAFKQSRK
jgi:hypothetical protein